MCCPQVGALPKILVWTCPHPQTGCGQGHTRCLPPVKRGGRQRQQRQRRQRGYWWRMLTFVQLGMPHSFATEAAVRALLNANLLRGLTLALEWCSQQHYALIGFREVVGITAWYAERYPTVCTAMAMEYLAACRQQAQQGQGLPQPSASLWGMLQHMEQIANRMDPETMACSSNGGRSHGSGSGNTKQDADSPFEPLDQSHPTDAEFEALPFDKLMSALRPHLCLTTWSSCGVWWGSR